MRVSRLKHIYLVGALTAFSIPTFASAETLTSAVNKACIFHPEVHTATILVNESRERVKEARSVILPRVSSVTEIGAVEEFNAASTSLDNSRPVSTRLSLDQPLYLGGRGRAAIKGAKGKLRSQQFQSLRHLLSVQLSAIQAYIDLARAADLLSVREESLSALKRRKLDVQRRYELGAGTQTDIVQAEARIERGKAEIITAKRDIREARAAFIEATGASPESELDFPKKPPMPSSIGEALGRAEMINPDIKSSEALMDAADQAVRSVQKTWYPEFRLIGDLSAQRDTVFNGFERDEASLRIRMNVPLLAGGAAQATERRTLYAKNRAYHERNLTSGRVKESVSAAWARFDASRQLTVINQSLVITAQKAAESVKKEADAGFRPSLDILDAQQELLEARLALTQSRYDEVLAAYIVRGLIGDIGLTGLTHCQQAKLDVMPLPRPKRKLWQYDLGFGVSLTSPKPKVRRGPRGK